ncbi:hypothetical protein ID866_8390 [Astraeus odoratus]|nr:hypothetical protein ID866_8390 [Astraeus odoratus]
MDMLFDTLRAEFCPPLDTALLAAIIGDLEQSPGGEPSPSRDQVAALRAVLKELASNATEQYESELCDNLDAAHLISQSNTTDESCSSPDYYGETTSESSVLSNPSFNSPLGFLQAALPHIATSKLRRALSDAGAGSLGSDIDMESVVENLLTREYFHELQERGLDPSDDDELSGEGGTQHFAEPKRKVVPVSPSKTTKKRSRRSKTITFGDVRQREHATAPEESPTRPVPDMWTQLSSLSEYLAAVLPSYRANFFRSYFHSPNYPSPAMAVRAALSDVTRKQQDPKSPVSSSPTDTSVLFNLLDIIRAAPFYASLDAEQRLVVYSDAHLALSATQTNPHAAFDIIELLLDLERDHQTGTLEMGVYHSAASPTSPSAWVSSPTSATKSPIRTTNETGSTTRRDTSLSPPLSPTAQRSPNSSATAQSPGTLEWQVVTPRKPPPNNSSHTLSLSIPAYNSPGASGSAKVRGSGNGFGKGGKGDVGELTTTQRSMKKHLTESWKKQNELLREASRAWHKGNSKFRGGEIAQYFAERVSDEL